MILRFRVQKDLVEAGLTDYSSCSYMQPMFLFSAESYVLSDLQNHSCSTPIKPQTFDPKLRNSVPPPLLEWSGDLVSRVGSRVVSTRKGILIFWYLQLHNERILCLGSYYERFLGVQGLVVPCLGSCCERFPTHFFVLRDPVLQRSILTLHQKLPLSQLGNILHLHGCLKRKKNRAYHV